MSTQLYPDIKDVSSVTSIFNRDTFFVIGIEGRKDTAGTALVGAPKKIVQPSEADTFFGASSSLATLIKFVLAKGVSYVIAVASKDNAAPLLADRQAAWAVLEEDPNVRIRLTDSVTQADLVALADSCEFANNIQHKQFCLCGMATPTSSSTLQTAAAAIVSKRGILVGPGIYDEGGVLKSGAYAAAWLATKIALNPTITDDLDLVSLAGSTGIEKDTNGMPVFRLKAGSGTPVNDFEVLLQAGVSPLRQGEDGAAQITHIRTTYTADSSYDSLMTLLIADQLFLDIRDLLNAQNLLRRGNTLVNQGFAAQIVQTYLAGRAAGPDAWVNAVVQGDGKLGFGVTVSISSDKKKMTVSARAEVVRNLQVIEINNVLSIPA